MKVILRDSSTDLYLVGPNMWTNDRAKALEFERVEHALEQARHAGAKDLELVVSFNHVPGDVHVPMAALEPPPGPACAAARP